MAAYYMLSTLNTFVCECVGIMPSDEPPPVWSPSSPSGHGGGFDPAARRRYWGKIKGEPMCKFLIALDTFVGLNG